jgi:NAD(P)-dependent dehydrogenase (short-subunit alcohol dehydrogenase family)
VKRDLAGVRVVMTGARGGIGAAATEALTAAGARVVGIDLAAGEGVLEADITDRDQAVGAVESAAERLGGIEILINNAGIGRAHDSADFPDAEARAVMNVNFFGPWTVTAAAMPHLMASEGHVVNVSSGLALVDVPYAVAYTASKRALDAYSAALRLEHGKRVSVTTVHPGYIRTPIHDRATEAGASLEGIVRADTVDQAAAAIVRACVRRPRAISTSRRSGLELWAAQRFHPAARWVLGRRFLRWRATAPPPSFLRFPD